MGTIDTQNTDCLRLKTRLGKWLFLYYTWVVYHFLTKIRLHLCLFSSSVCITIRIVVRLCFVATIFAMSTYMRFSFGKNSYNFFISLRLSTALKIQRFSMYSFFITVSSKYSLYNYCTFLFQSNQNLLFERES